LARVVLVTAKISQGDDVQRIVCRAKSNIGPDTGGFSYSLDQTEVIPGIFSSYSSWGSMLEGTARELLSEQDQSEGANSSALDSAKDFLYELLVNGELPQQTIQDEAEIARHSWASVRRAKSLLNIISSKSVLDKRWYWKLPDYMLKNG